MNKLVAAVAVLGLGLTAPVLAGKYEDALTAAQRGDYATARRLWLPLAEQGNAAAQYGLGFIYYRGEGVPQDYAEAAKWFRRAAEQRHANAQGMLSFLYRFGLGVRRDKVQAHMWMNLAAANHRDRLRQETAAGARDSLAAEMTTAQIAEAQKLAREWKPKQ